MRRIGIEIEARVPGSNDPLRTISHALNGAGLVAQIVGHGNENYDVWQVQNDGSLPSADCFEVASPRLDNLEDLEKACTAMVAAGAAISGRNTTAFGLHVHFDATDLTLQQVCAIALAYETARGEFDAMLPASRRNNRFCLPASHADQSRGLLNTVPMLAKAAAGEALNRDETAAVFGSANVSTHYDARRYRTVNVMRYLRARNPANRTIEFRAHSGTVEFSKIKNWVLILATLIERTLDKLANGSTAPAANVAEGVVQTGRRAGQRRIVKPSGKFATFVERCQNGTATFEWTLTELGWDRDATQANAAYVRSWGFPLKSIRMGRNVIGYTMETHATITGRLNLTAATAVDFFKVELATALPAELAAYVAGRKAAFAQAGNIGAALGTALNAVRGRRTI